MVEGGGWVTATPTKARGEYIPQKKILAVPPKVYAICSNFGAKRGLLLFFIHPEIIIFSLYTHTKRSFSTKVEPPRGLPKSSIPNIKTRLCFVEICLGVVLQGGQLPARPLRYPTPKDTGTIYLAPVPILGWWHYAI